MGLDYLDGKSWGEITREERYFCSILYKDIRDEILENNDGGKSFVDWVNGLSGYKTIPPEHFLDVGYETCFYRDILAGRGGIRKFNEKISNDYRKPFSEKRTFDLCLFMPKSMFVIEAKVQQDPRKDIKQKTCIEKDMGKGEGGICDLFNKIGLPSRMLKKSVFEENYL